MMARVLTDDSAGRQEAIRVLRAGGLVGLPTDTTYGLAANLRLPGSIDRLFAAKRRPPDRGIVLLLADAAQGEEIGTWPAAARALAAAFWPGGLTLVVRQRAEVDLPAALTGGAATIGLRVPNHPSPRSLAVAVGPLPTTSANLSGEAEAPDARAVAELFGPAVEIVLDGGPAPGIPASTVVDCSVDRPVVLRAGTIAVARLAEVLERAGIGHDLGNEGLPGVGR
jgi:L-threonylcarbamoyladenylate synthase